MKTSVITPNSKSELKAALISTLDGYSYNHFSGDIRKDDKYARVIYYYTGNQINIFITYWQDGVKNAVDYASTCKTAKGVINKVTKFLGITK